MKVDKKYILGAVGWLTGFLVYNLILFVLIGNWQMTPSFWCSYIFVLVAFLMQILVTCLTYGRQGVRPRDLFLGYPISRSAAVYLVVALIAGTVIMLIPSCDVKLAFVIQILILAVEVIFLVSGLIAKDHAEKMEEHESRKVFFVRDLMSDVQGYALSVKDETVKKEMMALAEDLRYSDPMSHEALSSLEQFIAERVAYIGSCVRAGRETEAWQACVLVRNQLKERNMKCKILK